MKFHQTLSPLRLCTEIADGKRNDDLFAENAQFISDLTAVCDSPTLVLRRKRCFSTNQTATPPSKRAFVSKKATDTVAPSLHFGNKARESPEVQLVAIADEAKTQ
jgi:hypothetical protein